MKRRKIIVAEFAVTAYSDGSIDWERDGAQRRERGRVGRTWGQRGLPVTWTLIANGEKVIDEVVSSPEVGFLSRAAAWDAESSNPAVP